MKFSALSFSFSLLLNRALFLKKLSMGCGASNNLVTDDEQIVSNANIAPPSQQKQQAITEHHSIPQPASTGNSL
jgi:hypothetical protein